MFKQLLSITTAYERYMTRRGRVMAHRILMMQSDRVLHDVGISREELLGGVSNWPWEAKNPDTAPLDLDSKEPIIEPAAVAHEKSSRAGERQAIRELNAYTDRELNDLGISRGTIEHAVRNGRGEIDRVASSAEPFHGNDKAAA